MPLAGLTEVLAPAAAGHYAVAGLVVLGWEDAMAYVAAAEAERSPVILQAGPACRAHTPLPVLAAMFRALAQRATVPVVAHLDHATTADECEAAIAAGFSSVMFDGSRLPLAENIAQSAAIVQRAAARGVDVEGEVGVVGYAGGAASQGTEPADAQRFAAETGVAALAVSIGNVHLQQRAEGDVDRDRLRAIEAVCSVPLVVHGGSGIPPERRLDLARTTRLCKFNVGTELRMTFGRALRRVLDEDPAAFDRIAILRAVVPDLTEAARAVLRSVGSSGKAPG